MAVRKLLVPTDGSDCAERAIDYAIKLARRTPETPIHLLTVHPPLRVYGEIEAYVGRERMRELAAQQDRAVLELGEAKLRGSGMPFTSEVVEGEPGETIARRASELDCEQIVMGTHGRGRVAALLVGSVATKVIHLAKVPVTLVK
jgi:nucleotide-binding universal stress UspA family protein